MQNPFQTILRFQKFFKFFFPTINFHCFEPYTAKVRKVKSAKNNFLVLFYSAKSVSDHFTISKLFQVFFRTIFFSLFRTLYCKGEKHEVRKKSFFSDLLYCKIQFRPFYDFKTFSSFFSNCHFFFSLF